MDSTTKTATATVIGAAIGALGTIGAQWINLLKPTEEQIVSSTQYKELVDRSAEKTVEIGALRQELTKAKSDLDAVSTMNIGMRAELEQTKRAAQAKVAPCSPIDQPATQSATKVPTDPSSLGVRQSKPPQPTDPLTVVSGPKGVEIALRRVERAGADILIHFSIANGTQDDVQVMVFGRGSRFGYGGSKIVADGMEYLAKDVTVSGEVRDEFISKKYMPGAPVFGIVRVNNVPGSVNSIDVISLAFGSNNLKPAGFVRLQNVVLR